MPSKVDWASLYKTVQIKCAGGAASFPMAIRFRILVGEPVSTRRFPSAFFQLLVAFISMQKQMPPSLNMQSG